MLTSWRARAETLNERIRRTQPHWRELNLSGGNPPPITFPTEGLRTKVMIALNPDFTQDYTTWNWTDIVRDESGGSIVRWEQEIDILFGGRPNSSVVDASTCKFRAKNDKRLSRRNPLSPYFNLLSEYTPVWIQLNYGQGFKDRYFGYIHDFSKAWDHSGNDAYVDLTARGPFHRFGKSRSLRSAHTRAVLRHADGLLAYWPGEDDANAFVVGSMVTGVKAMTPITQTLHETSEGTPIPPGGLPLLAQGVGPAGSSSLISFSNGGTLHGVIPPATNTGEWSFEFVVRWDPNTAISSEDIALIQAAGTYGAFTINATATGITVFHAINRTAANSGSADTVFDVTDGTSHHIRYTVAQDGANYRAKLYLDGTLADTADNFGSAMAGTVGQPYDLELNPLSEDGNLMPSAFGQWTFWKTETPPVDTVEAAFGHTQEMVHRRLRRICEEENIPFFTMATVSALCGPQRPGNIIDVFRDAEACDLGVVYEYKFGFGYKSLTEFYNQPISFTLDAALSHIKEDPLPVDNDLDFRNQWSVQRQGGSTFTAVARKGEVVASLEATELVYPDRKTIVAFTDDRAEDMAGWLAHRDSVDEDRWPNLGFSLAASPELINSWIEMTFGSRIQALNMFEEIGVRTLDQICRGYHEHWNSAIWAVTLNDIPSSTFNVAGTELEGHDRMDGDSCVLIADLTDSSTSFHVATNDINEDQWTTESADFPLDIALSPGAGNALSSGGEVITVASITSAIDDDFTRTTTPGWGTATIGGAWSHTGGVASEFATNGTQGTMNGTSVDIRRSINAIPTSFLNGRVRTRLVPGVVATGASFEMGPMLRHTNSGNYYTAEVRFDLSGVLMLRFVKVRGGTTTQLTLITLDGTYGAGTTMECIFDIRENVLRAKAWDSSISEPSFWQLTFTDVDPLPAGQAGAEFRIQAGNTNIPFTVAFDNFELINPQLFNVGARAVNGIVKSHMDGTRVFCHPMNVLGME